LFAKKLYGIVTFRQSGGMGVLMVSQTVYAGATLKPGNCGISFTGDTLVLSYIRFYERNIRIYQQVSSGLLMNPKSLEF
jgi:hypothetical protein